VPDTHEALRKNMQQEAAQEFIVRQSGELLFVVVSGIAPAKSHLAIGKGDQAMVGDGHAMGVAAEIVQHIFGTAEGTFQVHHPVLSKQWPEPSREDLGFAEELQVFGEVELTILEGLPEGGDELTTKNLAQYRFGQEVVVRRADPVGVIERETSGGHHTMDMGMKPDLLIPGVQHTEETNLCPEVSGIASDFEKSFRAGSKQEIVDQLFVLQHHWGQVAGKCEDHVQVARGEQFSLTGGDPAFPSRGLTLWTVPPENVQMSERIRFIYPS